MLGFNSRQGLLASMIYAFFDFPFRLNVNVRERKREKNGSPPLSPETLMCRCLEVDPEHYLDHAPTHIIRG